ncbi:MAG: hypothetical protein IJW16_02190 [Clostridia bacterium]|nr:hypothetical protein [Clostridia bacterium]
MIEVTMRNRVATPALSALTASTPTAIEWSENDQKMILVINNAGSAATTLTVKAGNGIQGVNDSVLTVPKGISLVKLESGRFKNVTGENKGKIVVVAAAALSVGVCAMV